MIICISLNPAIDRRLRVRELHLGQVNRASSARPAPGGKAAHVAMVARALGSEVLWVGFLGGPTGDDCLRGLQAIGIPTKIVKTQSSTRVNLEIIDDREKVTEILEPGGPIETTEADEMFSLCCSLFERCKQKARVVLSGSLPPGLHPTFYSRLIEAAHASGCFVLLDTSGEALNCALASSPDLIKPNREEAEAATELLIKDHNSAIYAARALILRGAKSVVLSLGAEGLLWLNSANAPPVFVRPPFLENIRSTVGCGDATLAGFAVAGFRQENLENSAILGVACGAANCLADSPGMIDVQEVKRLAPLVSIQTVFAEQKTPSVL